MAKRRTQGGPERGPAGLSAQTKRKIEQALKNTPEQKTVVGPLVECLLENGWNLDQIVYGKKEWRVPKSPSEATKREKHESFTGFPVDIAVFDDPVHTEDPRHLLFLIECKQPTEEAGVAQLESYFVGEPRAQLGVWANDPEPSARSIFVYRDRAGRIIRKRKVIADIPRPGEVIRPKTQRRSFRDLATPTDLVLKKTVSDLLDKVVVSDSNVTRREEQLDQLCNLLLLKLESDREAKSSPDAPVFFRNLESPAKTGAAIRKHYGEFVELYPGVFLTEQDKVLRFSDQTVEACVEQLASLRLIDLGVTTFALAFQVLRSEALKQGEGQYFTPQPVIEAGVRLMKITYTDLILDPACGTGGFLVQAMLDLKRKRPRISDSDLSRWAQTHIFGIDKDAIGVKLTKAAMLIAGDGSAHCVRGDSIRTQTWNVDFPHLQTGEFEDGRFSVIITNPPFGTNLKVSALDSRLEGLQLAKRGKDTFTDLEIGLLFLERAYRLLRDGGRIGIVLPETYFFSVSYQFVLDWLESRFEIVAVANIPMEAFQGFCRAKTNFYVFRKTRKPEKSRSVTLLNPRTCGIYKDGGTRYRTDPATGRRTNDVDNELLDHVRQYLKGDCPPGAAKVSAAQVINRRVLVPMYYDPRYSQGIKQLLRASGVKGVTIGQLLEESVLTVRVGHGSPPNDQRTGDIPYVKVSDLRALRININPTNLVSEQVARRYWRAENSGLAPWDLVTPSRASSNIGEFVVLLPGEERILLTKEVLVLRTKKPEVYDPFYLLWAFSLKAVRDQWRRIALMQTNREDCGNRYKEIVIPKPPRVSWAKDKSEAFRSYFEGIAKAMGSFRHKVGSDNFEYTANVNQQRIS